MNITTSIVKQKSNNLKRKISIHILFTSPFLFPLELFLIQLLKTVSSSIFNFHSRFYKIDQNHFRRTHYRHQFHWYHYRPVGIDAWRFPFYVSGTSITWQITCKTIHLEHIYIRDTIWNNIIMQNFILSYNIQHSSIQISHQ
jgi:hypothetical protein